MKEPKPTAAGESSRGQGLRMVQLQQVVGAERGGLVVAKHHQQHAAAADDGGGQQHALGDLQKAGTG